MSSLPKKIKQETSKVHQKRFEVCTQQLFKTLKNVANRQNLR